MDDPRLENLQQIRWIAFDAVGTLIFADPPIHMAYHRIGAQHGSALGPEEVRRRFRDVFGRRESAGAGSAAAGTNDASRTSEATERAFWWDVVREVLPEVPDQQACFDELFAHFARPGSWQCFADVEETLRELRGRGYRLAVASNFDARLHSVCDGLAGFEFVERRFISSEIGWRKPHPLFFGEMLERCGCRAEQMLVVGDDLVNDVVGARGAGLPAVHLDRSRETTSESIQSLTDLLRLLPSRK